MNLVGWGGIFHAWNPWNLSSLIGSQLGDRDLSHFIHPISGGSHRSAVICFQRVRYGRSTLADLDYEGKGAMLDKPKNYQNRNELC